MLPAECRRSASLALSNPVAPSLFCPIFFFFHSSSTSRRATVSRASESSTTLLVEFLGPSEFHARPVALTFFGSFGIFAHICATEVKLEEGFVPFEPPPPFMDLYFSCVLYLSQFFGAGCRSLFFRSPLQSPPSCMVLDVVSLSAA